MKKPLTRALGAAIYIVLIVFILSSFDGGGPEGSILMPMAVLSMLVASVAFMAFVFFYYPIKMYADGDKKGALDDFLRTFLFFACFAVIFVLYILIKWTLIR